MKNWQENQLNALQLNQNERDIFQQILILSKELGFDYCSWGLRTPLPLTNPKTQMLNNYPAAWQKQYQDKNYIAVDPTVQFGMRSNQPLIWTDDVFSQTPDLWEEASSYGLRVGWGQSMRDSNGVSSLLMLIRSNDKITDIELDDKLLKMTWLVQTAHLFLSQCLASKLMPEINVKLSGREIEILRWTADGKTSSDISCILKISERTVNFHVNNVLAKLNASNKTSATIKAAILGFL